MAELLIGDVFRASAAAAGSTIAVALGDRSFTYADLDSRGDAVANALVARGVRRGDRVVLWSDTDIDAVPLVVGLARVGAVFVPISALLTADDAAAMVAVARPTLLVVDAARHDVGEELAARTAIPIVDLAAVVAASESTAPYVDGELRETDPHVIFFTSGSTGAPKGVVLTHRVNMLRTHPGAQLEERGPTVCVFPLFHMGAWTIALQAFQTQSTLVLVADTTAPTIRAAVDTWRATHLNCVPAVWNRILSSPATEGSLSSLRYIDSGTSATPPELLTALHDAIPTAHRRVFYGSTEAGAVTLLREPDVDRKPGSCGTPQHSVAVRLDPATGELQVRGPVVFDGYFENAEADAEAFTDDGWFRTGDEAVVDDEGFLSIVGRVKDLIRTGGESVAPAEVEAIYRDVDAFADVAVVGLPDADWGEVVCLVAVVRDGAAAPSLEALREHAGDRLARFKVPRRFVAVDAIPRTPATNQVKRKLLVEQVTTGTIG